MPSSPAAPRPLRVLRPIAAILAIATLALAWPARAQAPADPVALPDAIDLVVPFPPGGGAEFVARQLDAALKASGGPKLRIVNRPGEQGRSGVESVAAAAADGTTLLLGSRSSLIVGPLAQGLAPYRPLADFEPVAILGTIPRLILVHPSVPVTTIDGLARLARSDPAAVPCGTSDAMSEHAARTFSKLTGAALACKAYDGISPALQEDLGSGAVKLAFESALLGDVQAGRLRALAVAGPSPLRALPGVPTASEAGLPGYDMSVWIGIFAPRGTPAATVAALATEVAKAFERADTLAALQSRGYSVRVLTGRAMETFFEADARDTPRVPAPPAPRAGPPP